MKTYGRSFGFDTEYQTREEAQDEAFCYGLITAAVIGAIWAVCEWVF